MRSARLTPPGAPVKPRVEEYREYAKGITLLY